MDNFYFGSDMPLTFTDIALAVARAPGVAKSMAQQTASVEHIPKTRTPGNHGFDKEDKITLAFRVFISTDQTTKVKVGNEWIDDPLGAKRHWEESGEQLMPCVWKAFENCAIPLPLILQPKTKKDKTP